MRRHATAPPQETALDALTAIVAWAETRGILIEQDAGGTYNYHLHEGGRCCPDTRVSGFVQVSEALTAGLQAKLEQVGAAALLPYLDVMEAIEAGGIQIEPTLPDSADDQYSYTLPGGASAGGFATEAAAVEAAVRHVVSGRGERRRGRAGALAIAA